MCYFWSLAPFVDWFLQADGQKCIYRKFASFGGKRVVVAIFGKYAFRGMYGFFFATQILRRHVFWQIFEIESVVQSASESVIEIVRVWVRLRYMYMNWLLEGGREVEIFVKSIISLYIVIFYFSYQQLKRSTVSPLPYSVYFLYSSLEVKNCYNILCLFSLIISWSEGLLHHANTFVPP